MGDDNRIICETDSSGSGCSGSGCSGKELVCDTTNLTAKICCCYCSY